MGSSQRISFGSQESAIAIITRWRMPPDSSCGYAPARRFASGMPTRLHQLERALPRAAAAVAEPDERPFGDLLADAHHRVERGHRLLEDHRDLAAPNLAEPAGGGRREIGALEQDLPAHEARGTGQQPDQRAERHRLARARLSDHAERLAAADRERRAVDCAQDPARELELDL